MREGRTASGVSLAKRSSNSPRRSIVTGLAVIPLVLFTACSQLGGVGVSRADDGAGILLHLARCTHDAPVTSARLRALGDPADAGDDTVLWEIRSDAGAPLDAITVGVLPAGFEQTVPLGELPVDQTLVADVTPELGSQSFVVRELQPDVYWTGEYLSSDAFREKALDRGSCDTNTFSGLRSFLVVLAAFVAGVLSLASCAAILIWRRRRGRVAV